MAKGIMATLAIVAGAGGVVATSPEKLQQIPYVGEYFEGEATASEVAVENQQETATLAKKAVKKAGGVAVKDAATIDSYDSSGSEQDDVALSGDAEGLPVCDKSKIASDYRQKVEGISEDPRLTSKKIKGLVTELANTNKRTMVDDVSMQCIIDEIGENDHLNPNRIDNLRSVAYETNIAVWSEARKKRGRNIKFVPKLYPLNGDFESNTVSHKLLGQYGATPGEPWGCFNTGGNSFYAVEGISPDVEDVAIKGGKEVQSVDLHTSFEIDPSKDNLRIVINNVTHNKLYRELSLNGLNTWFRPADAKTRAILVDLGCSLGNS